MVFKRTNGLKVMLITLVLLITLVGCGNTKSSMESVANDAAQYPNSSPAMEPRDMKSEEYGESGSNLSNGSTELADQAERLVIKSGDISLYVDSTEKAFTDITTIVESSGGFIQDSHVWNSDRGMSANLQLRIPAKQLQQVVEQLEALGRVQSKRIGGQDVTEEFVDLESRLRNLNRQEQRYLELLEQAKNVEDILRIEKELNLVRGEIERITGRLIGLKDKISFATLHVNISEALKQGEVLPPSFSKAMQDAKQGIINSVHLLLQAITGAIVFIGYLIPFVPVIWIGYYIYRKRQKNNS